MTLINDEGEICYCGSCSVVEMKKEVEERGDHHKSSTATSNSLKDKSNNSKYKRFEIKWSVDVDPGWLPDNKKT